LSLVSINQQRSGSILYRPEGGFGVPVLALLVATAKAALLLWLAPGHGPHADASGTAVG